MVSNKYIDFRKIENFVRSKCYREYVLKGKEKNVILENFERTQGKEKEGRYLTMGDINPTLIYKV